MPQPETEVHAEAGASCPISHRRTARTLNFIVQLLLAAIALCLVYIAITSRS